LLQPLHRGLAPRQAGLGEHGDRNERLSRFVNESGSVLTWFRDARQVYKNRPHLIQSPLAFAALDLGGAELTCMDREYLVEEYQQNKDRCQ
jgi:hypothetical protein